MRTHCLLSACCTLLVLCPYVVCQTTPSSRDTLRATAKQVFDLEKNRQKAGDCPAANTTADFNICFSQIAVTTDSHLKTYQDAVRSLLAMRDTGPPLPGPAGMVLTSVQSIAEFDRMEHLWRAYLDIAERSALHQFEGGTGGPSFQLQTHIQLVRNHMTELNDIYGMLLRL